MVYKTERDQNSSNVRHSWNQGSNNVIRNWFLFVFVMYCVVLAVIDSLGSSLLFSSTISKKNMFQWLGFDDILRPRTREIGNVMDCLAKLDSHSLLLELEVKHQLTTGIKNVNYISFQRNYIY